VVIPILPESPQIVVTEQLLHYSQPIRVLGTTYLNEKKSELGLRLILGLKVNSSSRDLTSYKDVVIQINQPAFQTGQYDFRGPLGLVHIFTETGKFKTAIHITEENTLLSNTEDTFGIQIRLPVCYNLIHNYQIHIDFKFRMVKKPTTAVSQQQMVALENSANCGGNCTASYHCAPSFFDPDKCRCWTDVDSIWTNGAC
jgi:hypothetical protein